MIDKKHEELFIEFCEKLKIPKPKSFGQTCLWS